MFVTFQLHLTSHLKVCLCAILTFIFLGPDLTFYNYKIGPKSDPESWCQALGHVFYDNNCDFKGSVLITKINISYVQFESSLDHGLDVAYVLLLR